MYFRLEYTDKESLKQFEGTICNFQYRPIKVGVPTVFHSVIGTKNMPMGNCIEEGAAFNTIETSEVIAVSEGEHIIIETVGAMYHFVEYNNYTPLI